MEKQSYWILCFKALLSNFVLVAYCKGTLCVEFENFSQCSSTSTWAVNAHPLRVNHVFEQKSYHLFLVVYNNTLVTTSEFSCICAFKWNDFAGYGVCNRSAGANCESCSYNSSTYLMNSTFYLPKLYLENDRTYLRYRVSGYEFEWKPLHNITVTECPKTVGSAEATKCSEEPCGYNCECQFKCPDGFIIDAADSSRTFKCNALAEWAPDTPTCKPAPTGSDAPTTTPTDTGIASGRCTPCLQNCGLGVTLPGAILIVVILFLTIYMAMKNKADIGERFMFILCGSTALFVAVWVAAVCLCFKAQESHSSYVAGSVLGAASIVGLAVVTLLFLMQIRSSGDKAGEGKAEEMVPMSM